jgi:processive 1,2-diacylglycerol beta-glucosyltransferase
VTGQRSALLLSGSFGMGHDALAAACASSLESQGWTTTTLDAMKLMGSRSGSAGEQVFRAMLSLPGLYDAFHFAALRTGSRLALAADWAARRQLVPKLRDYLDHHPADLVISVFATGAAATSELAARYPAMRHLVFCTDVTPHRLWVHPNVDLYLVTAGVAEAAVLRFSPDARVQVVPPPVRPVFYQAQAQASVRAELGIPAGARCVLLMSGAWGLGPVAAAAHALGDAGVHVLAVAGRNHRLERKLASVAAQQPKVRAFGFTDRVPDLMSAADLVLRRHLLGGAHDRPAAAAARCRAGSRTRQPPARAGAGRRDGQLGQGRGRHPVRAGGAGSREATRARPGAQPGQLGVRVLRGAQRGRVLAGRAVGDLHPDRLSQPPRTRYEIPGPERAAARRQCFDLPARPRGQCRRAGRQASERLPAAALTGQERATRAGQHHADRAPWPDRDRSHGGGAGGHRA